MTPEQAVAIMKKYYAEDSVAYNYLYQHSLAVAELAVEIAKNHPEFHPDIVFVHTSALLHDIGIFMTIAPMIGCHGEHPYLAHGYLGRELLEKEGYPEHALVCERHVGVGISKDDVINNKLPLPARDMIPVSVEQEIVCYADKYFSKNADSLFTPKSPDKILRKLATHGADKPAVFMKFMEKYGLPEKLRVDS
ncbi:MAG: HD domain-containing protein [Bacteroidales bacterium]|jgi:uncharacterized protein|nr:HD domain-containing protein [Bacteroidales bacterium]